MIFGRLIRACLDVAGKLLVGVFENQGEDSEDSIIKLHRVLEATLCIKHVSYVDLERIHF